VSHARVNDPKLSTPEFRTKKDEKLVAVQTMNAVCGVTLEGWVWLHRLGQPYLVYSALSL